MKALSVKQPWACLLVEGEKTIEVRSWATDYRGDLLICASAAPKNYFWHDENADVKRLLPAGCQIGIVRLLDVRPMTPDDNDASIGNYAPGAYAWVVERVGFVAPKKVVGRLKLFDVPDDEIERLAVNWIFDHPPPQGEIKYTKSCPIF